MEEQQEEYDKLTAKWGWSEPQGGAVFNESSWQQDPDGPQPQNPFGNGDEEASGLHNPTDEELEAKWGWSEPEISSTTPQAPDAAQGMQAATWKDPEIEALEREAGRDPMADQLFGQGFDATAQFGSQTDELAAKWGWKEPEPEAADSTTGHFVATSIQPFDDPISSDAPVAKWDWKDSEASKLVDADPEEVRREYEKVAAKWDRDLENFESNSTAAVATSNDMHIVQNDQPKSVSHCFPPSGYAWLALAGVTFVCVYASCKVKK